MTTGRSILFIVPDERSVYEGVAVKVGAFHLPSLAFAILGTIARKNGFSPEVLDLAFHDNDEKAIAHALTRLSPVYVGLTCTSATYSNAVRIASIVKNSAPSVPILIGGPHVSATVAETLAKGCFDFVFAGEGDQSFDEFLKGTTPETINGCSFRTADGVKHIKGPAAMLESLDNAMIPDYSLYDLSAYKISRIQARQQPVVWIETSRGCPFDCQICNKIVYGRRFRPKSVARVVEEFRQFHAMGIREVHIADDGFTTDMQRAEEICDELIGLKLGITWSCVNGIRVDRVTPVLLRKMRAAGCYRISFGIESGNQAVLDKLGKKISLAQIKESVAAARQAGMEVFGFFLIGGPDDTEQTMLDTIRFAKKLNLHLAKASIVVPFPGSPLFETYKTRGLLMPDVQDYRYFNVYQTPDSVYTHPVLSWETIERYYRKFYRGVYLNPGYILRRLFFSLRNGLLVQDITAALSMKWFGK